MQFPLAFVYLFDEVNQWLYRRTDGRIGSYLGKYPVLLLQTRGRKSGQIRTHSLLYVRDGEKIVICASNNGQPRHPGWYWNLTANPQATIQLRREHYEVVATLAQGVEYDRLWQKIVALRPQYAEYRTRTTRAFPIVLLQTVSKEK